MTLLFVLNRRAGRHHTALRARLRDEFRDHRVTIVDEVPPRSSLEAMRPRPIVVAVGGDGTVQRILRRVGTPFPCPLGVLPLGTANDLARAAGIPGDFAGACASLRRGRTRAIDLLEVNGIPFATSGGLGFPAAVADRADWLRASRVTGAAARACRRCVYGVAALLELFGRRSPIFACVGDASDRYRSWAMIVVSNQPVLGGFRPSPDADPEDGRLDLCAILAPRGRLRLAWLVWRIRRGQAARCRETRRLRTESLTLHTSRPAAFLGDGEVLCRGTRFVVRVRPGTLDLVSPDPQEPSDRRLPRTPRRPSASAPRSADSPSLTSRLDRGPVLTGSVSLPLREGEDHETATTPPPRSVDRRGPGHPVDADRHRLYRRNDARSLE